MSLPQSSCSPLFFHLNCATGLYVDCIDATRRNSPSELCVSEYDPGPFEMGVAGSMAWAPAISNTDGMLIVQERIASEILQEGLNGLDQYFSINIRPDWPEPIHRKRLAEAPEYVWFCIRRDILVEDHYLEWPPGPTHPHQFVPYRMVPVPGSHGGADVFGVRARPWTNILCTRKFVDAAHRRRWKGFWILPMDVATPYQAGYEVAYLKKKWPPESWYPPGVEGHPNNLETA